ncbi:hypothetical protein CTAYLR_003542 [Chrysophaeum taylorii]|uniref:Cytochrome b5 heme-binding domain-containing protein n=1 Tax=Chrysophaeum taylorii TaxID=2483200 RepID=A0AAD7UKZ8_9STRA|nr:hypothetical protein CTAYLR_003542 [Chrysophaeum taylorii]
MAWRRGTQNQQAKEIRKGHIVEFQLPSSHATAQGDEKVRLRVVDARDGENCGRVALASLPPKLAAIAAREGVRLHAHEHPAAVVVARTGEVEAGAIALNEAQRLNSRVCVDQDVEWTLYRGRHVAMDCREAAIGATDVEIRPDPPLDLVVFEARPRQGPAARVDGVRLASTLARHTFDCLVTLSEVFVVRVDGRDIVARVRELRSVADDDDDEYRGLVLATTETFVVSDDARLLDLSNNPEIPPPEQKADRVEVRCDEDDEIFPVRRALLRPCVSLTRVAQAGKGKYDETTSCSVPLDCCTFDRVLLYLEHAERRPTQVFKFDPLLAPDLLRAAEILGISGLRDRCRQVLGSFEERVSRVPIRLDEVKARNALGGRSTPRSETLLVLDYMVLDITRWLPEHPGGDRIIPDQALDCDCAVMFELYHVSRQSFLYLKEFYLGELALEDRPLLEKPAGDASKPFIDELRRHTPWRLDVNDLPQPTHKSF